jgi:hypothetical protein
MLGKALERQHRLSLMSMCVSVASRARRNCLVFLGHSRKLDGVHVHGQAELLDPIKTLRTRHQYRDLGLWG